MQSNDGCPCLPTNTVRESTEKNSHYILSLMCIPPEMSFLQLSFPLSLAALLCSNHKAQLDSGTGCWASTSPPFLADFNLTFVYFQHTHQFCFLCIRQGFTSIHSQFLFCELLLWIHPMYYNAGSCLIYASLSFRPASLGSSPRLFIPLSQCKGWKLDPSL